MRITLALAAALALSGALSQTALAAPVTVLPVAGNFPNLGVGVQSPDLILSYTNVTNASVTIRSLTLVGNNPGDFVDTSPFGAPLALVPNATVTFDVAFKPTQGGPRSAIYRAALDDGMGHSFGNLDVPLSGTGIGQLLQVNPNPIDVGGAKVGGVTITRFSVVNAGGGIVSVKSFVLAGADAGEFNLGGIPNLPTGLAGNQSIPLTVTFIPNHLGNHAATLTVTSDDPNNPVLTVNMKGVAGDPVIAPSVAAIAFGPVRVGASSDPQGIDIVNKGNSDLLVTNIAVNGADFSIDKSMLPPPQNGAWVVPVGKSISITATFTPIAVGARQGSVVVSSNDPNAPNKPIGLFGTGNPAGLTINVNNLVFGPQKGFQAAPAQAVIIGNPGLNGAKILAAKFAGPQAAWFRFAGLVNAPIQIAAMGMAELDVTALPLGLGAGTATLTITTDDPKNPSFDVGLSVTGVASMVSVDPPFADFGGVGILQPSKITITVTNNGMDVLDIVDFQLNDPGNLFGVNGGIAPDTMIDPGKSVSFDVTFTPNVAGAAAAQIELETNDPMARFVHIPVDAMGATGGLTVTPPSLTFVPAQVGTTSAAQSITINNTGDIVCKVTAVLAGSNPNQFLFGDSGMFTLNSKQTHTIPIAYQPVTAGNHSATVTISSNCSNSTVVKLSGSGAVPVLQIAVGDSMLDFGNVAVGYESESKVVGIRNAGVLPLTIDMITPSDSSYALDISPTRLALSPGVTTTFNVVFKPMAVGTHQGMIGITIKGGNGPLASVSVTGIGVVPVVTTPPRGCSMSPRRDGGHASFVLLLLVPAAVLFGRRKKSS